MLSESPRGRNQPLPLGTLLSTLTAPAKNAVKFDAKREIDLFFAKSSRLPTDDNFLTIFKAISSIGNHESVHNNNSTKSDKNDSCYYYGHLVYLLSQTLQSLSSTGGDCGSRKASVFRNAINAAIRLSSLDTITSDAGKSWLEDIIKPLLHLANSKLPRPTFLTQEMRRCSLENMLNNDNGDNDNGDDDKSAQDVLREIVAGGGAGGEPVSRWSLCLLFIRTQHAEMQGRSGHEDHLLIDLLIGALFDPNILRGSERLQVLLLYKCHTWSYCLGDAFWLAALKCNAVISSGGGVSMIGWCEGAWASLYRLVDTHPPPPLHKLISHNDHGDNGNDDDHGDNGNDDDHEDNGKDDSHDDNDKDDDGGDVCCLGDANVALILMRALLNGKLKPTAPSKRKSSFEGAVHPMLQLSLDIMSNSHIVDLPDSIVRSSVLVKHWKLILPTLISRMQMFSRAALRRLTQTIMQAIGGRADSRVKLAVFQLYAAYWLEEPETTLQVLEEHQETVAPADLTPWVDTCWYLGNQWLLRINGQSVEPSYKRNLMVKCTLELMQAGLGSKDDPKIHDDAKDASCCYLLGRLSRTARVSLDLGDGKTAQKLLQQQIIHAPSGDGKPPSTALLNKWLETIDDDQESIFVEQAVLDVLKPHAPYLLARLKNTTDAGKKTKRGIEVLSRLLRDDPQAALLSCLISSASSSNGPGSPNGTLLGFVPELPKDAPENLKALHFAVRLHRSLNEPTAASKSSAPPSLDLLEYEAVHRQHLQNPALRNYCDAMIRLLSPCDVERLPDDPPQEIQGLLGECQWQAALNATHFLYTQAKSRMTMTMKAANAPSCDAILKNKTERLEAIDDLLRILTKLAALLGKMGLIWEGAGRAKQAADLCSELNLSGRLEAIKCIQSRLLKLLEDVDKHEQNEMNSCRRLVLFDYNSVDDGDDARSTLKSLWPIYRRLEWSQLEQAIWNTLTKETSRASYGKCCALLDLLDARPRFIHPMTEQQGEDFCRHAPVFNPELDDFEAFYAMFTETAKHDDDKDCDDESVRHVRLSSINQCFVVCTANLLAIYPISDNLHLLYHDKLGRIDKENKETIAFGVRLIKQQQTRRQTVRKINFNPKTKDEKDGDNGSSTTNAVDLGDEENDPEFVVDEQERVMQERKWWTDRRALDGRMRLVCAELQETCFPGGDLFVLAVTAKPSAHQTPTADKNTQDSFLRLIAQELKGNDLLSGKNLKLLCEFMCQMDLGELEPNVLRRRLLELKVDCQDCTLLSSRALFDSNPFAPDHLPSAQQKSSFLQLGLSRRLQAFPWESCPAFRPHPCIRLVHPLRPVNTDGKRHWSLPIKSAFMLLNPQGDLMGTQERFSRLQLPFFVKSFINDKSFCSINALLKEHDLYLYFGHSSSQAFYDYNNCSHKDVNKAAAWLIGCSSGKSKWSWSEKSVTPACFPSELISAGRYGKTVNSAFLIILCIRLMNLFFNFVVRWS